MEDFINEISYLQSCYEDLLRQQSRINERIAVLQYSDSLVNVFSSVRPESNRVEVPDTLDPEPKQNDFQIDLEMTEFPSIEPSPMSTLSQNSSIPLLNTPEIGDLKVGDDDSTNSRSQISFLRFCSK